MTQQTEFQDFVKDQLRRWKTIFDEMDVQFSLGRSEMRDMFDRERKNFEDFISKQRQHMKTNGKMSEDHRQYLKAKMEILAEALSADMKKSEPLFKERKDKIMQTVHEMEFALKETYAHIDFILKQLVDEFKMRLDDYRLKLALCTFENVAMLDEPQAALKEKLDKMLDKIQKRYDQEEKIEAFMNEINTSFDHFKKAFSDLMS
jgi:ribosomal protein L16 Arg81 hydroxylase